MESAGLVPVIPVNPVPTFVTWLMMPPASATRKRFEMPPLSAMKNSERLSGDHCGLMFLALAIAGTGSMVPVAGSMTASR